MKLSGGVMKVLASVEWRISMSRQEKYVERFEWI